jgi:MerR family copper efflux transcriptional regulator
VKALTLRHVQELDRRIAELVAMRETLNELASSCHGDARPDCPILADIAASDAGTVGKKRQTHALPR